ncbi:MAG TPA: Rieske 2Fe-2S domain-containing protein [Blastocatellia bacterium]|nr:Rieske 2Fe-2S domain-containing protein [Blastocatellia bacterium]
MGQFVKVAKISDLSSGKGSVVDVNGRAIALFNVAGQFYALDNICAHRGGPLGEGYVDCAELSVQCPLHGWVYRLVDGVSPMIPNAKVEAFEVKIDGDDVMINV